MNAQSDNIIPLHRSAIRRGDRTLGDPDAVIARFSGPPVHEKIDEVRSLLEGALAAMLVVLVLLAVKLWPDLTAFVGAVLS